MKVQLFIAAGVAALCAAGAASAAEVEIEDAVARVVVIPEARSDIAVDIRPGRSDLPQLKVSRLGGGKVEIDGGLDRRIRGCSRKGLVIDDTVSPVNPPENLTIVVRGLPDVKMPDAPLITLRVPMDVKIEAGGAVFGAIGRSDNVELSSAGCGDWTVANTKGRMHLSMAGSGDIQAGTSSSVEASIAGSGDIRTGATRSLEASIAGSGDVRAARVDGPIDASIAGSGDVSVDAGRATRLEASIAGSGDVRFGGEADSLKASVLGSGDVRVAAVRGPISKSVMGSGDVVVGR